MTNCKAAVYHAGSYRASSCSNAAKRDGFCGTHHPDAVKARDERVRTRRNEKSAQWQRQMHAKTETQRKASEFDAVVAERDKYRVALSEIAGYYENTTGVHVDILIDIARGALEATP